MDHRQLDFRIDYTPHRRIRLVAPDGTEVCREEGTGADCVRQFGLPPFGFAGAYRSHLTGVTYMRNRWYAPKLGQFLSHDPLGYLDSYNLYAYAGMDPINFWDPYGLGSQNFAEPTGLQEAMLNSELSHPDALGKNLEPGLAQGHGFKATKAVAEFVAEQSVGLLYGAPLEWAGAKVYGTARGATRRWRCHPRR